MRNSWMKFEDAAANNPAVPQTIAPAERMFTRRQRSDQFPAGRLFRSGQVRKAKVFANAIESDGEDGPVELVDSVQDEEDDERRQPKVLQFRSACGRWSRRFGLAGRSAGGQARYPEWCGFAKGYVMPAERTYRGAISDPSFLTNRPGCGTPPVIARGSSLFSHQRSSVSRSPTNSILGTA